jgi:hypothetical protein
LKSSWKASFLSTSENSHPHVRFGFLLSQVTVTYLPEINGYHHLLIGIVVDPDLSVIILRRIVLLYDVLRALEGTLLDIARIECESFGLTALPSASRVYLAPSHRL